MLSLPPISGLYFKIMTGKKPTQSKYCNSYHPIENESDFAKRYILLVTIGFENVWNISWFLYLYVFRICKCCFSKIEIHVRFNYSLLNVNIFFGGGGVKTPPVTATNRSFQFASCILPALRIRYQLMIGVDR